LFVITAEKITHFFNNKKITTMKNAIFFAIFKHKFSNNNTCSNWGIVKHGVLQGSIMEILLFFYLNT